MHEDPLETHPWMIGLDSWIIQDGNYPDFVTGQRTDFALEFASRGGLRPRDEAQEVGVQWFSPTTSSVSRTRSISRRLVRG